MVSLLLSRAFRFASSHWCALVWFSFLCQRLLARLESSGRNPNHISVEYLPSDTVEAPRNLSGSLVRRLQEVADRHDGKVPLYSRLFAQWVHHAYPSECIFPHAHGFSSAVSSDEWWRRAIGMFQRMSCTSLLDKKQSYPNGNTATIQNLHHEVEIMWTEEEELSLFPQIPLRQLRFSVSSVAGRTRGRPCFLRKRVTCSCC